MHTTTTTTTTATAAAAAAATATIHTYIRDIHISFSIFPKPASGIFRGFRSPAGFAMTRFTTTPFVLSRGYLRYYCYYYYCY